MIRHQVIVNPVSGRGAGERAIPQIESLLQQHGLTYDLVRTERPWHAAELARRAAGQGYDVVVAVGGDGTANEVINGLLLAREAGEGAPALGVLSVGRGNDYAHGIGIPRDLAEACQVLAEGRRWPVDVGRVRGGRYPDGRFFGNCVGIGFDAVVGFEAVKLRFLSGFPGYLVAVLKTVFLYFRAPLVQVDVDGRVFQQPCLMVSVMNGRRLGGGFFMAPHGRPDDGLLDLCVVHQVGRRRVFGLIPHFLRGTQATQPEVRMEPARHAVLTALQGVLPAHVDGETLCTDGQRLEIELLPQRLEVISRDLVPERAAGQGAA